VYYIEATVSVKPLLPGMQVIILANSEKGNEHLVGRVAQVMNVHGNNKPQERTLIDMRFVREPNTYPHDQKEEEYELEEEGGEKVTGTFKDFTREQIYHGFSHAFNRLPYEAVKRTLLKGIDPLLVDRMDLKVVEIDYFAVDARVLVPRPAPSRPRHHAPSHPARGARRSWGSRSSARPAPTRSVSTGTSRRCGCTTT
jgi:hypothetical protein